MFTRVHLVNGKTFDSLPDEDISLSDFKRQLGEMFAEPDGWQVNIETLHGWMCFPKHAVAAIEIVGA